MDGFRSVKAMPMPDVKASAVSEDVPEFRMVSPADLLVEEAYQRTMSERSVRLIRQIVAGWDWKAFKPPVCAAGPEGKLFVIDGQHTAVAAASHPGVTTIPVMVVQAAAVAERAQSFVQHNRDRIAMTMMQIHHAQFTAGDEIAVAMVEAASKAGARILKNPPANGVFKRGDTVAIAAIRNIVQAKGVNFSARLLKILVDADRAPVGAPEIKAVFALLTEPDWKDACDAFDLATVIRSKPAHDWSSYAEAYVRKGMKMPLWRAVAIAWFKQASARRRSAA